MVKSTSEFEDKYNYPLLTILVGIQCSGKSTIAQNELKKENTVVLSSDGYRKENPQWDNNEVFKHLYEDMNKYLKENKDVIIDATNITLKSRRQIFSNLKEKAIKKCLIINTPYDECLKRLKVRNQQEDSHKVPEEVLKKYLESFEMPFEEEGFDYIDIHKKPTFKESQDNQTALMLLAKGFDQHNKHHTLTLDKHMEQVANNLKTQLDFSRNNKSGYQLLILSALWHDIGKVFTQTYKERDPNAHYYNHANVGAYYLLCSSGIYYPMKDLFNSKYDDFIYSLEMTLDWLFYINYHMCMYNIKTDKAIKKWKSIFGEYKFYMLEQFNKADACGHLNKKEGE